MTFLTTHCIESEASIGFHWGVLSTFCKSDLGLVSGCVGPEGRTSISLGDRRSSGPQGLSPGPLSCPTRKDKGSWEIYSPTATQRTSGSGNSGFPACLGHGRPQVGGAGIHAGRPVRGMWGTCPSVVSRRRRRQRGAAAGREKDRQGGTGKGDLLPAPAAETASESQPELWPWSPALLSRHPWSPVHRDKVLSWGLWAKRPPGGWPQPLWPPALRCPRSSLRSICPPGLGWEGGARRLEGAADAGGSWSESATKSDSPPAR